MNKSTFRKLYKEKRSELAVSIIVEKSGLIANRFFENIDLGVVKTFHTYLRLAKFNEIDTSIIYFRLWRDFDEVTTVAPRMRPETYAIESVVFNSATDIAENSWGIREPVGGLTVEPGEINLVIVPLLCFDERGYRVGYGKGIYDRFLAECRPDCIKVGLSFEPPVKSIEDVDGHDIALDICVTPYDVYKWNEFDTRQVETCLAS